MKITKNILFLFLFLLPFILNGQEESAPKVDPNKSWGLGINTTGIWGFDFPLGIDAFYQIKKHEFGLTVYIEPYYSKWIGQIFQLRYNYYPNEWKKRLDFSIESSLVYGYGQVNLTTGYGLRLRVLKHFYITNNFGYGFCVYRRNYIESRPLEIQRVIQLKLGVNINLNSFKWKRD